MTTVFFLTHIFDIETRRRYYKLKRELPKDYKLKILADLSTASRFRRVDNDEIVYFDTQVIAKESYAKRLLMSDARLTPGNIDQLLLWASSYLNESDYFWLIEYDVVFTGNWNIFFRNFENNESSFLATSFQKESDCPYWSWWQVFRTPDQAEECRSKRNYDGVRCFTPVMRISADALSFLRVAYSKDLWIGHMEAVMPTALERGGYSIEDIGGNSFKTPNEGKGNWYTNTLSTEDLSPGTFRYRPPMRVAGRWRNMLYHPVKVVDRFQLLFFCVIKIGGFLRLWRS